MLIIGVLNNGLNLLGVSSFYQQVVKGVVIIIAVLIDRKTNNRGVGIEKAFITVIAILLFLTGCSLESPIEKMTMVK